MARSIAGALRLMARSVALEAPSMCEVPHVVRTPNDRDLAEMMDWCRDPDRPGTFDFYGVGTYYVFRFSDANLAFEFRMTWG
jgi:hypothetical protein